jgi:heat shock protein HslJ
MPYSQMLAVVIVMLTIVAMASSGPSTTRPDTPLLGTRWTVVEIEGQPALPADREGPYLEFSAEQTRYVGSGGVNRIGGRYQLEGKSLKLGEPFSTMMAGPEPLMQQEQKMLQAMRRVDSFEIVGNNLTLLAGDDVVLRLEAN